MDLLEGIQWGKEIVFWLLFFVFNFSVFAFYTLINFQWKYLIPLRTILLKGGRGVFIEMNPDFYRICLDLSLIIILFRFFSIEKWHGVVSIYFGLILTFNVYHYAFSKIYQTTPAIANDGRLILNAIGILWGESKIKILLLVPLFFVFIYGMVLGFEKFLEFSSALSANGLFVLGTSLIGLYVLLSLQRHGLYKPAFDLGHRILAMPTRVAYNIKYSLQLISKANRIDFDELDRCRNLKLDLATRPNIYCLFVESYGSILLKEEELKSEYISIYKNFCDSLTEDDWSITTNLSESVSAVGPSWLAYTSVLFGNKVSNNFQYEFLLNKEEIYKYDTLMKIFMKEGYNSYNLNATKAKPGVKVPFDQMKKFYGIDQWILRNDIKFRGARHGFTESPPDQFVMNYAYEEIISKAKEHPFILFYLTKNSHSPFISPEFPANNWRDLDGQNEDLIGAEFLRIPKLTDYMKAIKYQMLFINAFIKNHGKEDDVFLLVGDHQPHDLGNKEQYGKETLVHVISKNQKFINGFEHYGFRGGLDNLNEPVKHEAIYSLFVREIMRTYGKNGVNIPPYEPNGIQF